MRGASRTTREQKTLESNTPIGEYHPSSRDDNGMTNVEHNVVYGMHSGLALLMDVYRPAHPQGLGVVYINGSGWHAPLGYDAGPLKETPLGLPYIAAMQA